MSELSVTESDGAVVIQLDEDLYPKDAIYGAAYIFIDRCYVLLDRPKDGRISVRLKAKAGVPTAAIAGEFENELLAQAWRRLIVEENRSLIEQVTTQALTGAAGPPGLDDLLDMNIGEDTAFDDPLGIAMSWEEKYKKKSKDEPDGAAKTGDKASETAPAKDAK